MSPQKVISAVMGLAVCLSVSSCFLKKKSKVEDSGLQPVVPEVAQEIYILDDRSVERPVGWTSVTTFKLTGTELPASMEVGPRKMEGTISVRDSKRRTLQSLGKDLRRLTVQRDNNSFVTAIDGVPPNTETKKGVLVGKYIIMEREEGAWKGHFESGDEASPEEREAIEREARHLTEGDNMYTEPARRIGDEWDVDAAAALGIDDAEGSLRVRFDRIEEHRGEQCAVITGKLEVLSDSKGGDEPGVKIAGDFTAYRSLEHLVDLDVELKGTMEMTMSPQLGVTFTTTGPIEMTERTEVTVPDSTPAVSTLEALNALEGVEPVEATPEAESPGAE